MDKNLKYAILDELKTNNHFDFDKEEYFEKKLKKEYDSTKYDNKPIKEIEKYFQDIKLSKYPLSKVNELSWTAYSDIVYDIWGQYDGEDDYFNIQSLDGIEICPNIKSIHIEYVWNVKDLSPLNKLKLLEEITIFSKTEVESLKPLLVLSNLKKLKLECITFKDQSETDKVIEELKKKGVKVDIK
jgi:hypothetical protein